MKKKLSISLISLSFLYPTHVSSCEEELEENIFGNNPNYKSLSSKEQSNQKDLDTLDEALKKHSAEAVRVAYALRKSPEIPSILGGVPEISPEIKSHYEFLDPVYDLKNHIEEDGGLGEKLEASLKLAKDRASALDGSLYKELAWPVSCEDYYKYLGEFLAYIPHQSGKPAWKIPGQGDEQDEVYYRLCHFYWLIDQKENDSGPLQDDEWFKYWIIDFNKKWGIFLDTPLSFGKDILESFRGYAPKYRVGDSMMGDKPNMPSGWLTFNQFFARTLNPGLRPITGPDNNMIITVPADCTHKEMFKIEDNSTIKRIVMKGVHKYASIQELLEGSKYKDSFAGGTFVHYFLSPHSYHRFHAPVSGNVEECFSTTIGNHYLEVEINKDTKKFNAPDNAKNGYQFTQTRGIITFDTTNSKEGNVGIVAVIPVGMCQVSSVNMIAQPGKALRKGDEFGYFIFGGSDIILLFQKHVSLKIDTTTQRYSHYGEKMASVTGSAL